jgi:hypothetical protein
MGINKITKMTTFATKLKNYPRNGRTSSAKQDEKAKEKEKRS